MDKHDTYAEYAKRVKLFAGLRPSEVGKVLKQGRVRKYKAGKEIFRDGQVDTNLFIVTRGEVGIHVRDTCIVKCRVGDGFGATAALDHAPHSGTAVAHTDCECLAIDEDHLVKVLEQSIATRFLLNVIHMLSNQLETINAKNARLRAKLADGEGA